MKFKAEVPHGGAMPGTEGTRGAEPLREGDRVEGLLLDVDPVTYEGRTVLRLWVRVGEHVVTVLDTEFEPYFYCVPEEGVDAGGLADALRNVDAQGVEPAGAEVVSRNRGLEPTDVVRVWAQHPGDVPGLREVAARVDGVLEVLEADIPYHYRYLIDKDLRPVDGVRFTAEHRDERWFARDPEAVEMEPTDLPLRLLAFDLEVHNPRVTPNAEQDPIIVCAVATGDGRVELLQAEEDGEGGIDDEGVVRAFLELLEEEDPDVVLTYNGDGFDMPYLRDRAEVHGIELTMGRDGSEPEFRRFGPNRRVDIVGRSNVDLFQIARRDLPDVKVKTLENVSEHLGIVDEEERTNIPGDEIAAAWDDPERRPLLLDYARDDVESTLEMGRRLVPLQVAFARMAKQPLTEVTKMGRGRQVDWYLVDAAHRRGRLVPNRGGGSRGDVIEGGWVMEPTGGLHEDIRALDFSAMYPSIMIAYNISPDTYVPEGEPCGACHEAPEVEHRFREEPEGFFRSILQDLTGRRKLLKAELAGAARGSDEARLLDIQQQALKVLTNSFYGYMGWQQARWYSKECAEATTAWGRHLIRDVIERAEDRGIEVIYGDTDSLFVRETPDVPDFVEEMNRELPLELEMEDAYEVIFFTGAKKRYAGLTREGDMVVKGLEVRRGDWCDLAKRIQQDVLDLVLRERDPEEAARHVQGTVERLKAGEVPIEDLTIHKTLTQRPDSYKVKGAHVLAVEAAAEENPEFEVPVGAKVGYVILSHRARDPDYDGLSMAAGQRAPSGSPNMSERAKLTRFLTEEDEVDAGYYIDKQVVPAAHRVLERFGYSEDELKGKPRQQSLMDF